MFQSHAHKRPNFYQFLWVIPLNWRTIGFDWTRALLPPSHNPSYPLFPSCQSVSPQFTPLMELSDYIDFSCVNPHPSSPPGPFDTVSTSTSVTDWTMRHMTSVQTGDKNEIRHVIQRGEVSGNDCPSPLDTHVPSVHTHTNTNCKHMIGNLNSRVASPFARCVRPVPA